MHNACCVLLGGEEEMHRAHEEAVEAIFVKKEQSHEYLQRYSSRKTGKAKWAGLEMWAVKVSLLSPLAMRLPAQHISQHSVYVIPTHVPSGSWSPYVVETAGYKLCRLRDARVENCC